MSGRLIITLTGMIKRFFRFFNRLLGLLFGFTGAWVWLFYGLYKSVEKYNLRFRYSDLSGHGFWIILVLAVINLCIFAYNCYKFYRIMPDNVVTRLIRGFFEPNYRPEREGNNVPTNMITTSKTGKSGFFFGVKVKGFIEKYRQYVSKPDTEDGHILVIGGAGSGKSATIAKNALETWQAPIVAIDIKGELSAYVEKLKSKGIKRKYVVFNPTNKNGLCYDPYYLLHHGGEDDLMQNAREIALAIIPLPINAREPFWVEAAQNILAAAILYYFDLGLSFTETMITVQTTPPEKILDDVAESQNMNAKMCVNTLHGLDLKTLAGIATEMSNKIMVFAADPRIRAAMCDSRTEKHCFNWDCLDDTSVFLNFPQDKLKQWASVTRLLINQAFKTLERRADKGITADKIPPVLMMMDEMPRLDKIETIEGALASLRSKNVTICLILQSLAQLDKIYGKDERKAIIDNCWYKAILSATDADSQKYLSELVGTCEVEKESHSIQYDVEDGVETGRGSNWSKHREPIIFPHEFAKLKDVVLMTPEGFCRVDKVYAPRPDEPLPKEVNPKAENEVSKTAANAKTAARHLENTKGNNNSVTISSGKSFGQFFLDSAKTPSGLFGMIATAAVMGMLLTFFIMHFGVLISNGIISASDQSQAAAPAIAFNGVTISNQEDLDNLYNAEMESLARELAALDTSGWDNITEKELLDFIADYIRNLKH